MKAQYVGICEDCGEVIELGEDIEYDDEIGVWVHEACQLSEVLKIPSKDTRNRCFRCCDLIVNGKCRSCEE